MAREKGVNYDSAAGRNWFAGFRKRNPNMKLMSPLKRDKARQDVTDDTVATYFEELKKTMEDIGRFILISN